MRQFCPAQIPTGTALNYFLNVPSLGHASQAALARSAASLKMYRFKPALEDAQLAELLRHVLLFLLWVLLTWPFSCFVQQPFPADAI